uniref:AcidPPc domain-containing protein n=1 Tax=Panagrellus redivivus TaxID=6233 RepID=A0A7E4ZQY8_PANRE
MSRTSSKQSKLIQFDAEISRKLLLNSSNIRLLFLLVEWSVHGIPWLILSGFGVLFAIRWNAAQKTQWQWCVLLFGIVLDLALIGISKITVQRARPPYNTDDQVYEAPVADKFSFPSGHSSRAAMLTVMGLTFLDPSHTFLRFLAVLFPFFLGYSRIAMGRHYFFDVVGGLTLGYFEGQLALLLPEQVPELLRSYFPFIFEA